MRGAPMSLDKVVRREGGAFPPTSPISNMSAVSVGLQASGKPAKGPAGQSSMSQFGFCSNRPSVRTHADDALECSVLISRANHSRLDTMSDSEEDVASIGKQKSIFSGMGRVKQINHLREKWSPKPKSPLPDRTFVDTPPSSPWSRRSSPDKEPHGENGRRTPSRMQVKKGSPRRQPVVSVLDMERYLAINTWLEHNGINVVQINTAGSEKRENPNDYGLFDDMYSSLEVLECSLKTELSHLHSIVKDTSYKETADELGKYAPEPSLFDYLAVIGADMLDVKIRNFWNQRENVFEATVAFAHPPESQFHAESLEHFCFPTGIKTVHVAASLEKRNELPDERVPSVSKEGDFFVLMISGGGLQGQSIQYAMCMQGTVTIRGGGDDAKNLVLPICYCIVAQIPLIPFFRAVLQGFLDNLQNEFEASAASGCGSFSNIVTDKHASYIDDILQNLRSIPLPDKGLSVSANVFPSPSPELTLTRPHKENNADEKVALLLQWALPSLLSRLSIDRLLQILSFLLVEMKLIVVSDEISLLSSATLGLASLLHPLAWAGPLISVLPLSMHEYMEAPVPLICGVDELPYDFECSKGTCILYLMENRVQLHEEDECTLNKLQMPELESLSCDLTRFTKQMLGRVAGSFRDNVMPLSTHLVIHRIHRHIEYLISTCASASDQYRTQDADASEKRFIDVFVQTQMYQKYQDDQPITSLMEQSNQQVSTVQTDQVPIKVSSNSTQHDELKAAASVLFQIALAGVSTLPRSRSRMNISAEAVTNTNIDTQTPDIVELPIFDEPETGSIKLSSAAPTPSARIFTSLKNSPKEKAESPTRFQEPFSPILSETSIQTERRPDRTFVWPLSQSELDVFWVTDETSVTSPGCVQHFMLSSPLSEIYDSPRRSPNNESDVSYGDDIKSVSQGDSGMVNTQRADTETTISIFDTGLSEVLGSGYTAEDAWLFEPSDDQRQHSQHDYDSDDDRSTKHESSAEADDASSPYKEELTKDCGFGQSNVCASNRRSWQQDMDDYRQNHDQMESHILRDIALTPEQMKVLMAGISVDSRGAWEGWCEGKMFVSSDFTTLTWERRAIAFAALKMSIADITNIATEDRQTLSSSRPSQRRVQLSINSETIYFQFSSSFPHDDFFSALKQLIPQQGNATERHESFPSLVSPIVGGPHLPPPITRDEKRHDALDEVKTAEACTVTTFLAQKLTDIEQFKRKLQRGFLVEKHGRLGKPHTKIIFTDTLCSHIMWRKPTEADTDEQQKLANIDDQLHHRSSLFSHSKNIPVDSITAIVTGKQTTVFRRTAASKSNDRACLSILTPTRTLDVCAYSLQGFQELYRGFSLLLEEINRTRDGLD